MLPKLIISQPNRPYIPGYGISENKTGLLSWDHVDKWIKQSKNFWISTTLPNGKPHARPIWGVWYKNIVFVGGGSTTRSFRNLQQNPNIVVHTESGSEVVIIEGTAKLFEDETLGKQLSDLYAIKYNMDHPPPFYGIIPTKVFAWNIDDYENTPTRWIVDVEND